MLLGGTVLTARLSQALRWVGVNPRHSVNGSHSPTERLTEDAGLNARSHLLG